MSFPQFDYLPKFKWSGINLAKYGMFVFIPI